MKYFIKLKDNEKQIIEALGFKEVIADGTKFYYLVNGSNSAEPGEPDHYFYDRHISKNLKRNGVQFVLDCEITGDYKNFNSFVELVEWLK